MRRLLSTAFALVAMAVSAFAQTVTISEPFTGTALSSGWVVGGTGYTPILTAPSLDTSGNGWLRLTSSGPNQATYAVNTNSFASKNATISVAFDYSSYNGSGADGITFFLADASKTFGVGAYGGSLGYAQKTAAGGATNINGMSGGYIGVGIDEFGNYSNATEGRVGGTGFTPNSIAVRGPGDGLTGYDFLGGTGNLGTNSIAFPGSTTRPAGADTRSIGITISATNQMIVSLSSGGGSYVPLYSIDLSGYTRPDDLILGFTGSTGGSTDIHEVRNVSLTSVTASIWTTAGGDSQWGTAGNWVGSAVPPSYTDVLLDNTFASSAQSIDLGGATRTIRSLMVDAPFSYGLSNGTIAFNGNGVLGPSGVFVSATHGNANHTVGANMTAANAVEFKNDSTGSLAFSGTLANGGNSVTVSGAGDTSFSGVASGGGAMVKNGTGNATLSGANTYSGGTTLNAGTLTANHNTALGSGGLVASGGTLASTNGATLANTVTLQGNVGLSGITVSGAVTQTNGNYTLAMDNATVSGGIALSNNNTAHTLTTQVDAGTSTLSGVVSNGGTGAGNLTKTGDGTLIVSGANTYTGTTTINGGTLRLGASDRLADAADLTIGSAGTFSLGGYSERIDNLTAAAGATIDFGSGTGANTLLFDTYTAPASGVMVVNNWESAADNLATTVNGQAVGSIYFSGYGVAGYNGTATLYGATSYLLRPIAVTEKEWDGSSSTTWSTNNNWTTQGEPSTTEIALFDDLGVGQNTANMTTDDTIAGIRFGDGATVGYNITGNSTTRTLTLAGTVPYIQQQSATSQTISVQRLSLNNNTVVDITGAGNLAISSSVRGTGGLIKDGTGAGKLILSGDSTFSGGVYINNGAVQAVSTTALGTGATTIAGGATLELAGGITPANAITASGDGLGGGGAIRNVSGNNTASGAITLAADTRINSDAGTLTLTGGVSGANDLNLGGAGNITVSGVIGTGTGGVTIDGTGTVTLSGTASNTYTGVTTVDSGTVNLSKTGGAVAIGTGGLVINGGTVTETVSNQINSADTVTVNGGTFALGASTTQSLAGLQTATGSTTSLGTGSNLTLNTSGASSIAGTISGAGQLTVNGTGTAYLLGNNTYSGGTTATASVRINSSTSLGTGAVTVNAGGNVQLQNNVTVANNFTLNSAGTTANNGAIENFAGNNTVSGAITLTGASTIQATAGNLSVTGNVTGAHALTFDGNGNTTVSGNIGTGAAGVTKTGSGSLTLSGANAFTGSLAVSEGSVVLGANNALTNSLAVSIASGATFDMAGRTDTIGSISGAGVLDFSSGSLTLTGASTFSGSMTDAGTLTLASGSTLLLSSSINDASLDLVLAGGTLSLGAIGNTFGKLTVTGNSILDFGNATATSLSLGNLELAAGVTLTVQNWANAADYFFAQGWVGSVQDVRGNTPMNQIVFTGYSGNSTNWQSYDDQITPVPEPSTYGAMLMSSALSLFGWRAYRRRKRHA